ncbi:hypothetical protein E2562_014215 [Oryza meyeriana var. granulata]|uniref:non-specific serine/threonine protein kinase n=1 Tax=Oryza meyeriana var. granulata TaxID=110450 RepID=A0A6G1BL01_9ORYZ|nr:hypothetical protein E2562_014215 [Oryza meyeriana var. granulata]
MDGTLLFGFYNLFLSIWFTNSADRAIAWSANQDRPVHKSGSKHAAADHAELMDSGNLVVKDQGGVIPWQSFDHPTNTLLPMQPVTTTAKAGID